MAVGETPGQCCQNGSKKFVTISSRKHNEMSSFRLNNGFRLQKTNRAVIRWKQPPQKPFHHVSRDKILHDSWSISAALARGFSDRHFKRGEEVVELYDLQFCFLCFNSLLHTGSIRKTKRKIGGVGGGNSPPTCIYPPSVSTLLCRVRSCLNEKNLKIAILFSLASVKIFLIQLRTPYKMGAEDCNVKLKDTQNYFVIYWITS